VVQYKIWPAEEWHEFWIDHDFGEYAFDKDVNSVISSQLFEKSSRDITFRGKWDVLRLIKVVMRHRHSHRIPDLWIIVDNLRLRVHSDIRARASHLGVKIWILVLRRCRHILRLRPRVLLHISHVHPTSRLLLNCARLLHDSTSQYWYQVLWKGLVLLLVILLLLLLLLS
jgi:hypothetical protein